MGDFILSISKSLAALSIAISSIIPFHYNLLPQTNSSPQAMVTPAPDSIVISRSLSYVGKNVSVLLTIPKNGGNIMGTVSGDCSGSILGVYEGPQSGHIQGNSVVTCPMGFIAMTGKMVYDGTLNPQSRTANVRYTLTTNTGISNSNTTEVSY